MIDKAPEAKYADRSWDGVKVFCKHKMQVVKDLKGAKLKGSCTGLEKLEATVNEEVIEPVHRQLSDVSFVWTDSGVDVDALKQAPLINRGFESEFA